MEPLGLLADFLETGGDVLWLILAVTFCLFVLILERYWFFLWELPTQSQARLEAWEQASDKTSWSAEQYRRQLLSEVDCQMIRNLNLIMTLIAALPLLGLLGTVTGMIQVFDVMAFLGSGNPRAMADGVSSATFPTMAGMVVALLGIPFSTELNRRYQRELRHLSVGMATH